MSTAHGKGGARLWTLWATLLVLRRRRSGRRAGKDLGGASRRGRGGIDAHMIWLHPGEIGGPEPAGLAVGLPYQHHGSERVHHLQVLLGQPKEPQDVPLPGHVRGGNAIAKDRVYVAQHSVDASVGEDHRNVAVARTAAEAPELAAFDDFSGG